MDGGFGPKGKGKTLILDLRLNHISSLTTPIDDTGSEWFDISLQKSRFRLERQLDESARQISQLQTPGRSPVRANLKSSVCKVMHVEDGEFLCATIPFAALMIKCEFETRHMI
jgi:hypothetical protein